MVINNWQVLQDAFVDTTGEWARLYFIFWWLLCTLVCLNMCVSLILDVNSLFFLRRKLFWIVNEMNNLVFEVVCAQV